MTKKLNKARCWRPSSTIRVMETGCCPVCDKPGDPVKASTVQAITQSREDLSVQRFRICLTPTCRVVYYSPENTFTQDYVKIPIWFKENATPKYICYCAKVTEQQILNAINQGATTLESIIETTGAMKNSNCETKNPTGRCCAKYIKDILGRTFKSWRDINSLLTFQP